MTLEQRIAQIVALDCLTPDERADMILAQPEMQLRRIRVSLTETSKTYRRCINAIDGGHYSDGGRYARTPA